MYRTFLSCHILNLKNFTVLSNKTRWPEESFSFGRLFSSRIVSKCIATIYCIYPLIHYNLETVPKWEQKIHQTVWKTEYTTVKTKFCEYFSYILFLVILGYRFTRRVHLMFNTQQNLSLGNEIILVILKVKCTKYKFTLTSRQSFQGSSTILLNLFLPIYLCFI